MLTNLFRDFPKMQHFSEICCILGIRHAVSSKVQGTVKVRKFKKVWNLNSIPILFCNSGFHGDAVNAFDGTLFGVRVTDCARQPDRCPGGPLNSCAPGRNASSPACSKCKLGYSDAGKDCEPCGEGALSAFGLFGLVLASVERFDRRGTEPFELFRSEFGQNSARIEEILLEFIRNSENFNIF